MEKWVGLDKIVEAVYESDIELLPPETREKQKNANYEAVRVHLNKIFDVIGFNVSLLKGNGGFANRGVYQIPREDGPFIEWMIKDRNDDFFRVLKAGEFERCDQNAMAYIIDNLSRILGHLDVDEDIIELQKKIMEQKTQIYIRLPFQQMGERINRSAFAIYNLISVDNDFLSYDETCEYLQELESGLDKYLNSMEHEYLERNRKKEEELKKKCPMLTNEEVEFSMRSHSIMEQLQENEEYRTLREEYESLFVREEKKTAQKRERVEKRKAKIIERIYEIFHDVTSRLPVDVKKMTPIEKYMCLCGDNGFRLHYCKEEQRWLLHTSDRYFALDWIKEHTHPVEEDEQ